MPAIDAEVGIGGEYDRIRERFGHAQKAGVGEAHGHVCISSTLTASTTRSVIYFRAVTKLYSVKKMNIY
jgi:histidyl-tRNA synthetase